MKVIAFAAAIAALTGGVVSAAELRFTYSSYFAFGDSLSDDGKLEPFLLPPSVDGAFTNGLPWTEILAQEFKAAGLPTANLAIGGARAFGPDPATVIHALAPDSPVRLGSLQGQIGFFDDAVPGPGVPSFFTGNNPLVSIWTGANDVFSFLDSGSTGLVTPTLAADAVAAGIQAISALGAQFDDFVVLNLPDLGRTPRYSTLLGDLLGVGPAAEDARDATTTFNDRLDENLDALRLAGLTIHEVDIFSLFNDIVTGNLSGDLLVFQGVDPFTPCTLSMSNPALNALGVCPDADLTLFADAVHPNRIAHEVIAARVAAAVIPVPATFPLLAGGLVLGAMVARRRRS